jgi:predicted nuclease with TOPRIM domain
VGGPDFVCNCNCDDGSQKKCIYSDAPAPVAEKYKEKLEEGQQKLEEGQQKLEEGQQKLEEGQQKLQEAEQKLGISN